MDRLTRKTLVSSFWEEDWQEHKERKTNKAKARQVLPFLSMDNKGEFGLASVEFCRYYYPNAKSSSRCGRMSGIFLDTGEALSVRFLVDKEVLFG